MKKEIKKALIGIDIEYDFLDGGKLGVNGSKEKFDKMPGFIYKHGKDYVSAFLTDDFHPVTHCSFKQNGGIWPLHCQQHTMGAAIYQPIIDALNDIGIDYHVLTKGTNEDREEYSVMRNPEADIYCVKDSIEDFHREFPDIKINVLIDFIGFMDEKKFYDFLEKSDYIEVKKVI